MQIYLGALTTEIKCDAQPKEKYANPTPAASTPNIPDQKLPSLTNFSPVYVNV
jgi:hypothetical protein